MTLRRYLVFNDNSIAPELADAEQAGGSGKGKGKGKEPTKADAAGEKKAKNGDDEKKEKD